MTDATKADELADRARIAQVAGLRATAAALYRKAARATPAASFLRDARFSLAKQLGRPKRDH